jgi:hypothetical protein
MDDPDPVPQSSTISRQPPRIHACRRRKARHKVKEFSELSQGPWHGGSENSARGLEITVSPVPSILRISQATLYLLA